MKALVTIKFKSIMGKKVDKRLLLTNPALLPTTETTISKLCQTIEKYFSDYKIKVKVNYELIGE